MNWQTAIEYKKDNLEYLGNKHFLLTLGATLLFHIIAGYGIYIMPRAKVLDIPVRMLNIRLGDSDVEEDDSTQAQLISENTAKLENDMARLSRPDQPKNPQPPLEKKQTQETPKLTPVKNKPTAPSQFIRDNSTDNVSKNSGVVIGNSIATNAEIKSNYEQIVSLWIKKFQVYPEDARQKGYVGTPIIRVRFDRRGNIRRSFIEATSGYEEIDRAALEMVNRANPVPAVPDDYPNGDELLEFRLPVTFK